MAVQPGKDYAAARKTTWVFQSGVGDATALITRHSLFIFPHSAIGGTGRTVTETDYKIGGRKPVEAIMALLADSATTPEQLEEQMRKWSAQVSGPIVEHMSDFKRVRIFTGFIRRSVVLSKKEKGFEMGATSIRPSKEELPAFLEFFKDYPALEIK
ncbi:MAG: hypothetical protein IT464_01900 [Planctomycetes bacterium]|nr:hypothetical protein [Planctomycetota bacterium]